jgi:predicted PurR-regulated permease PerM
MTISFQKLFFTIASFIALFAILVLAKTVLIPLAFSLLTAFILFPVARKMESWGANKIMSAFLSMLALFLIVLVGIYLFSSQIIQLSDNFSDFKDKIIRVVADATLIINENMGFVGQLEVGELYAKLKSWFNESIGALIKQTFSDTSDFLIGLISSIVYTFLFLIYRNGLINALVHFFPTENRAQALKMFKSVQKVGQQYLFGMFLIVLIVGLLNSFGLWIIGIDNPFLFGFLAAVLAIIPYVGTLLGAAIPILYAFISYDSIWLPATIAVFFWAVQFFESNYLTPKIVGGNLEINAFTSILSIIIGASVWGIAGMILFLPFAAIFKVICDEYVELKPVALLIGNENYNNHIVGDTVRFTWLQKLKRWFS